MIATLDGCFAKLRRAKEHLELFEEEARRELATVRETLVTETAYDPDVPRFLLQVVEEPVISFRLSAIAGDIVQNLRSALDYLAYQLVLLATGSPWDSTQWPIVATFIGIEDNWRFKGLRTRLVESGRWELWALIECYQAVWYEQEVPSPLGLDIITQRLHDLPLLVLAELSNRDKHRLLLEPFVNVAEYTRVEPHCIRDCATPALWDGGGGLWYTLKKDAPPLAQFTATITGPDPKMKVDIDFIPRPVSFVGLFEPAIDYLVLMANAVRTVLEDFAPFF